MNPNPTSLSRFQLWQYQWRGWILGGFFFLILVSRFFSLNSVEPFFLVFVMMGTTYRLWTAKFIGPHTSGIFLDGKVLSHRGPYGWGRHPLYFSNLVTAFGLVFFANSFSIPMSVFFFLIIFMHHYSVSFTEEQYLLSEHGEHYQKYRETTPRWLGIAQWTTVKKNSPRRIQLNMGIEANKPNRVMDIEISWTEAFKNQRGHILKSAFMAILIYASTLTFGH